MWCWRVIFVHILHRHEAGKLVQCPAQTKGLSRYFDGKDQLFFANTLDKLIFMIFQYRMPLTFDRLNVTTV